MSTPTDLTFKNNGAPYWDFGHWQGNPNNKARQVQFVDRPHAVFGSKRVFRAECVTGDNWPQASGSSAPRSLVGAWTGHSSWYSGATIPFPKENSRFVAAIAIEIPVLPKGLLPVGTLWEKHHSNQMGALAPVAPLSISAYTDGWLGARLGGGQAHQGGWQTYWSNQHIAPLTPGVHLFVFDVKYSKGSDGYLDVHHALDQDKTFDKPVSKHTGEPTWPWAPNLPPEQLYEETGIYPNGSMGSRAPGENFVYLYGSLEWFDAVDADLQAAFKSFNFDGGTAPSTKPVNSSVPVVSGTMLVGKTVGTSDGVWSNAPTSYAYQWQYTRDGTTWQDVSGATTNMFRCDATFVGCKVRVNVTATNGAGSTVATSDPTPAIAEVPPQPANMIGLKSPDPTADPMTMAWTPTIDQHGYVVYLDGAEVAHSGSKTESSTRIDRPNDGKQHTYRVSILTPDKTEYGEIIA